MQAGKLRNLVTLQRPVRTTDELGASVVAWETVRQVWTEIKPATARELARVGRVDAETSHVITARYAADVAADCRLTYAGRTFNITGVVDVGERRRELAIYATEVK
ncbi:MAG: hypothetical protein JWO31_3280 [Phycisphaerales bacterium]|nr:hypothetical protein [Phycisphaerales bacterium]